MLLLLDERITYFIVSNLLVSCHNEVCNSVLLKVEAVTGAQNRDFMTVIKY